MKQWFHYTQSDLSNAFRKAGIVKGDTVFSHVDIRNLGIPKEYFDGKTAVDVILDAMLDVIGSEGTFLVPTYSYSLCSNEIYDPQKTPSKVGAFGDKFRQLKGVKRSCDPIFSVAGIGPKVEELFSNLPNDCLGKDCIYGRLLRIDAKVCNIGLDLFFITPIHHFEQIIGVPYRFPKLFSGYVLRNGKLQKERWLYTVRVLNEYSRPAAYRLGADAEKMGLCHVVPIGAGQVTAISLRDAFDIFKTKFKTNPWYLAQGPPCNPIELEKKRVGAKEYEIDIPQGANMEQMIRALWYLPRDIVSDGYDAALEALSKQVPMTIYEYPTGTECFTWIVPEKWTCHVAYLETMDGKRIFSYSDNPLHVVSYSLPFDGEVSRDELFKHLHVHSKLPDAVPFTFKYYERDWGLCCSRNLKDSLTDKRYRVVIKTDFSYGTLKVGEVVVKGESEECFVLCAHLCHPNMVNDDMTGVAVGIDVMRKLLKRKRLRYTYRFIILPETIGSAAFLSHNEDMIPKMIGGLFLDMLATRHSHMLKLSLMKDTQVDRCIKLIVKEHDPEAWIGDFIYDLLNDERMFNAPGIRVPMLSLGRVLPQSESECPYREFHSSFDTPENADFKNLDDSRDMVLKIIDALEQNRIPKPKFKGELFCSRFNGIDYATIWRDIFNVVFLLDGHRSVTDIALESGISFVKTKEMLDILEKEGLIEWS